MDVAQNYSYWPFAKFWSLCPMKLKSALILCLLNDVKAICSFKLLSKNDVMILRQMFLFQRLSDLVF